MNLSAVNTIIIQFPVGVDVYGVFFPAVFDNRQHLVATMLNLNGTSFSSVMSSVPSWSETNEMLCILSGENSIRRNSPVSAVAKSLPVRRYSSYSFTKIFAMAEKKRIRNLTKYLLSFTWSELWLNVFSDLHLPDRKKVTFNRKVRLWRKIISKIEFRRVFVEKIVCYEWLNKKFARLSWSTHLHEHLSIHIPILQIVFFLTQTERVRSSDSEI